MADIDPIDQATEDLTVQFTRWKQEVKRLLVKYKDNVLYRTVADKVGGYSLEQLEALIDQELAAHVNNRLAHGLSLSMLGGMTKATFDGLTPLYYPRHGFPFTQIKALAVTNVNGVVTIPTFDMLYMGRPITVQGKSFTIAGTAGKQYFKVVVTGPPEARVGALVQATIAFEDQATIVLGHAVVTSGTVVLSMVGDIFRLGYAIITQNPRGKAIPATAGTPATTANLASPWFS